MAYIARDKYGIYYMFNGKPHRTFDEWHYSSGYPIYIREDVAKRILKRNMTWEDEPIDIHNIPKKQTELKNIPRCGKCIHYYVDESSFSKQEKCNIKQRTFPSSRQKLCCKGILKQ